MPDRSPQTLGADSLGFVVPARRRWWGSGRDRTGCGGTAVALVYIPSDTRASRVDTFQTDLGPAELRAGPFCVGFTDAPPRGRPS
jgi:hypothetical protein